MGFEAAPWFDRSRFLFKLFGVSNSFKRLTGTSSLRMLNYLGLAKSKFTIAIIILGGADQSRQT